MANLFIERQFANLPTPTPAVSKALVPLLAMPIPNDPVSGAQGSKRMTPGRDIWVYGSKHDLISDQAVWAKEQRHFLDDEARWRGLGVPAGPQKYATEYDGTLMLNDLGQPIKPTVYDAQHFTLVPYLVIAAISPEKSLRSKALQQAAELVDLILADRVCKQGDLSEISQRANGWSLEALGHWYAATGDPRVLAGAKAIVGRCNALSGEFDDQPYVTLNVHAGADHGFRQVSGWMTGRIFRGGMEWASIFGMTPDLQRLAKQCAACEDYVLANGVCDDYFPAPWDKGNVLDAWAYEAAMMYDADHFGPLIKPLWEKQDRFSPSKGWKASAGYGSIHNASVSLALAPWFGFRE